MRNFRMSNDLIVVDNSIVTSAYNLTVNEQRLIYCALKQIPKGLPIDPNTTFFITRDDFLELGADPTSVAKEIRQATRDLMRKTLIVRTNTGVLEFQWLRQVARYDKNAEKKLKDKYPNPADHDKYINALKAYNFFDNYPNKKNDGNIVARVMFSIEVLPLLSELKANFTQFLANDVAEFGSIYSFRSYQLLMQYKSTGYVKISLDDLRFMLMLTDKYPLVADLKRWVIETAVKEINEKSPYAVKYEMLKKGRKFTHLELKFKLKESAKKRLAERDPDTIDWVNGHTDNEANDTLSTPTPAPKAPSWQTKGLTDAQISKLAIYITEFVDANSGKISPSDRRDYAPIFDDWKPLLKDPMTVNSFHKIQELLDRQRV